jgi:hypothetical protein
MVTSREEIADDDCNAVRHLNDLQFHVVARLKQIMIAG